MTIERKPLSAMLGIRLSLRLPHDSEADEIRNDQLVIYRADTGEKVASVGRDDLFDVDGNRFFGDC